MDENTKLAYRDGLDAVSRRLEEWYEEGLNTIIALVKSNGGFLKTPQSSDGNKPALYAYYEDTDRDWSIKRVSVAIQGLHWDDELGLCICTDEMLDNYQFDTGYEFEYYLDFEGEDLVQLNKALDDAAYYVEIDKYDCCVKDTILSLIHGLPAYL